MKNTSDLGLIVCVQSMQFFIFAVGVYRQSSLTKQLLSKAEAAVYLPVLLFFYSTTYYFLNKLSPELAAWISLGFAGGLFAIYHFFKKSFGATNTKDIVEAFLTIVLLHSGYFQLLPDWAKPSLLPLFLLLNLVARNRNAMPTLSKIVKMGFQFVSAIELGKICFALLSTSDHRMSIFAVATVILAYLNYGVLDLDQRKSQLFLVVTNLLAVLMIYNVAYQFGSVAISLGWAAYAFLVLAYGWQQRDKGVIHSSLVIIIMATIKALVFDAITSAPEVRVLSLIVTGVVLYATGWLFKRVSAWE